MAHYASDYGFSIEGQLPSTRIKFEPTLETRVAISRALYKGAGTDDEHNVVWFQRQAAFWYTCIQEFSLRDQKIWAQETAAHYHIRAIDALCDLKQNMVEIDIFG